jgi:twitching motility protein PilT
MFRSTSLLAITSILAIAGLAGCSGSSEAEGDVTEGAVETHSDLAQYSLVTGLISADDTTSKSISDAILSTSRKADQSDRKHRDSVFAGIYEEGDDDPIGVVCGLDGATRKLMCSLTAAVALTENVKGREVAGLAGMLLPTSVKLTGKIAEAVAAGLPQRVGSGGVSAAGPVECKTKDGNGRVAAHEIMIGTPAIRNLIREAKVAQMYSAIQTGGALGMQTLDQNLQDLVKRNLISMPEARAKASNKDNFVGG